MGKLGCKRSLSGEHSYIPIGDYIKATKIKCVLCGHIEKIKKPK